MLNEYNSKDVADRLRGVAKLRGVSMKEVLEDCGINYNAMTHMRKSMPNGTSLGKLADRLGCSVDYLLGRTQEMLTAGGGQIPPAIPVNTAEMMSLYIQLQERDRLVLLQVCRQMLASTSDGQGGQEGGQRHGQEGGCRITKVDFLTGRIIDE